MIDIPMQSDWDLSLVRHFPAYLVFLVVILQIGINFLTKIWPRAIKVATPNGKTGELSLKAFEEDITMIIERVLEKRNPELTLLVQGATRSVIEPWVDLGKQSMDNYHENLKQVLNQITRVIDNQVAISDKLTRIMSKNTG